MSNNLIFKLRSITTSDSPLTLVKLANQAADEIERLGSLISEILPYMLNDMEQGLQIGHPPFEQDHCKNKDVLCPDCQWFEDATLWKNRVDAGEFKDYI